MAGRKKKQPSAPQTAKVKVTALPSFNPFVTLKISPKSLRSLNLPQTPTRWTPPTNRSSGRDVEDLNVMNAQHPCDKNLTLTPDIETDGTATANQPPADGFLPPPEADASTNDNNHDTFQNERNTGSEAMASSSLHTSSTPGQHRQRRGKSILQHSGAYSAATTRQTTAASSSRTVTLQDEPEVFDTNSHSIADADGQDLTHSESDELNSSRSARVVDTMSDAQQALPPPQRPTLKLKLSKPVIPQVEGTQAVQTPPPPSATRAPSIKLKLGGTPTAVSAKPPNKEEDTIDVAPVSSTKKRKRPKVTNESEDELARPAPKPPGVRKITLKNTIVPTPAPPPKPALGQTLKIKAKGKPPKRPLGVGYDSELEEREQDPVIHEGFILRMQPGPDCDYLRKAIEDGAVGKARALGGADVRMRMLDTLGRRGIMIIRGNQYATTLVDLPCIIEGMKSWDKKGWIKSVDISQMLLVLGRCNTDEEARNYPLPEDVDPKNYQYAHGITAPMKWVRKRRFARTKRARVDDIEAVERRVKALLEADKAAVSTRYQLLDHDPRLDEERYSSGLEEDDDEDAEAEYDDDGEGYFDLRNGQNGGELETPMFTETPVEDIGQEDVDEFERMFAGEDDLPTTQPAPQARDTLHIPEVADSSFGVTSTSASPSVTMAHTPASAAEASSDEDEDEEGGEEDADLDDAEKEGDENLQQIKDRIQDMQQKIAEQTEVLKQTQNAILKKKLARKIQDLKDDVAMMKKNAGLGGDEDDD